MSQTLRGVLAACVAGMLVAGAWAEDTRPKDGKEKKTFDDSTFVKKAASGGMHEVKLGEIAAKKAMATEVKEFGQKMVKDHSKANEQLKKAAKAAGIEVPTKMHTKHSDHLARFTKLEGKAFDAAYVRHMIRDHEEDVEEFEKATKELKNADLRKFAEETLPVIREHLKMIKKIGESMGIKDTKGKGSKEKESTEKRRER